MQQSFSFNNVSVYSTQGTIPLANEVCKALKARLPSFLMPENFGLTPHILTTFNNENFEVQVNNVRGNFVVVIHSMASPVHNNLFELFCLLDAIDNSQAEDLLLVMPYMDYARSDRKDKPRISVMAPRLANILNMGYGIKRVILLDPHDTHTKHYFKPSADEITALHIFIDFLENSFFKTYPREKCIICFPDANSRRRYKKLPEITRLPFTYIDKFHPDNSGAVEVAAGAGSSIKDKICLIIDDEILTGNTTIEDVKSMLDNPDERPEKIFMFAVHPVLNHLKNGWESVIKRLEESPVEQFFLTDSIPILHKLENTKKIKILSVARLLAEAISRTVQNQSLTALHEQVSAQSYRPDW